MAANFHNVMDIIHVWVGQSLKKQDDFYQYFALNAADREAGTGASQLDNDLGIDWYDDDLIGIYFNENGSLSEAIEELPLASAEAEQAIRDRCRELHIEQANALFYYSDAGLEVADSVKKYNGLTYLGAFDNH